MLCSFCVCRRRCTTCHLQHVVSYSCCRFSLSNAFNSRTEDERILCPKTISFGVCVFPVHPGFGLESVLEQDTWENFQLRSLDIMAQTRLVLKEILDSKTFRDEVFFCSSSWRSSLWLRLHVAFIDEDFDGDDFSLQSGFLFDGADINRDGSLDERELQNVLKQQFRRL